MKLEHAVRIGTIGNGPGKITNVYAITLRLVPLDLPLLAKDARN
jgi:hypothetical protein